MKITVIHSLAIQDYNKAIEQHPTDANVYYYRALLKKHLSHIDETTNDLPKSIRTRKSEEQYVGIKKDRVYRQDHTTT